MPPPPSAPPRARTATASGTTTGRFMTCSPPRPSRWWACSFCKRSSRHRNLTHLPSPTERPRPMSENDHGDRPGRPGEPADPLGRRQFLRGLAGAGALAGAGGLLAACSSGSPAPAASSPAATAARKRGGALKVGLTGGSGSDTLDPHKGLTYLDTARAQSLYQPLLQLNTRAQSELVLAEEISPHGSTSQWVIRLRPGITFHDGKPLTADDVIFTLQRIINGKLTGSN